MDTVPDIDPEYPNQAVLRPIGPRADLDEIIARRMLDYEARKANEARNAEPQP